MTESGREVERWRREIEVTGDVAYLDHATIGPLPRATVRAMSDWVARQGREGSGMWPAIQAAADVVLRDFAAFIGARPEEVARVAGTAMGVTVVAEGLPWRDGESVVLPEMEFPANRYPWLHLRRRGVEVRCVPARDGRVEVDDLVAACDGTTRVVAVSVVQFSNGFRADVTALGEACRARGIRLVVDGMQAVGAVRMDVGSLPIDALACQSYKWLLGPHGAGWLYVRRDRIDAIEPLALGSRSITPGTSFLDQRFELKESAGRFETGIVNYQGIAALGASLEFLAGIGIDVIERRVLMLSERLGAGLLAKGCRVLGAPRNRDERSAIVTFLHPGLESEACYRRLLEAGVVTCLREGAIRVSPHVYNTEDEIDRLLDALS